jgi:DNA-binding transcriptional LysR family regulator
MRGSPWRRLMLVARQRGGPQSASNLLLPLAFSVDRKSPGSPRPRVSYGPDLRDIEMVVSSEHSSDLAQSLSMGRLDAALMRAEPDRQDLEYIPVAREPFVVVMRSGHRLTAFESVDDRELAGEAFISGSNIAGVMRKAIEDYLAANALEIEPGIAFTT